MRFMLTLTASSGGSVCGTFGAYCSTCVPDKRRVWVLCIVSSLPCHFPATRVPADRQQYFCVTGILIVFFGIQDSSKGLAKLCNSFLLVLSEET